MSVYLLFTIKRYLEQLIMSPFVILGHIIGLFRKSGNYDIYFFIPIYGVGGAEYVNAKILDALNEKKKIKLIFTKKSYQTTALHLFQHPNVHIEDISKYADNKFLFFMNLMFRGIMATEILKQAKKPIVFVGQCNFGYKLTPHLYRKCKVIDIIHGFDQKFTRVWMPFTPFLEVRMGIAYNVIKRINQFQKEIGIPEKYHHFEKLTLYVNIPEDIKKISRADHLLKVYYAGRNSSEKRVYLMYEIARKALKKNLPVQFNFVGDFSGGLPEDHNTFGNFPGLIPAGNQMYDFIRENDIVLLTSDREGLPIMLLEAMQLGIVPITTPTGDIPVYINNANGYILDGATETEIVDQAVAALEELSHHKEIYSQKSHNAQKSYLEHFSKEQFEQVLLRLFSGE